MGKFLDEVRDQPDRLRFLVERYENGQMERVHRAGEILADNSSRIVFTGMGTSYFCPIAIKGRLLDAGYYPEIYEAGELLHYYDDVLTDCSLVAISQSGESAETRKVLAGSWPDQAKISVTNDPDSTIAQESDLNLEIYAGEERSISNKTYTNTLAVLLILAEVLDGGSGEKALDNLTSCADSLATFLREKPDRIEACADFLGVPTFTHFVSRGPSMTAARQGALTSNEGARIFTQALPGGSFRHGPLEVTGENHRIVMLAPEGRTYKLLEKVALEAASAGSKVAFITDATVLEKVSAADNVFPVQLKSSLPEEYFPILSSIPVEMLLNKLAENKGLEAGVFTRVTKITTEE
uniref:Glucosamine--fructose-6-phosphate aminotransferase n=1 Tax=uncultured organism TaxID=155900 RepID=M1Q1L1_9ZZZZ|nr:glucosamine--fructose-6-phosphate aminotransferase [uncultured organism]